MIYYGSRISDNLSTSPEGFLICHNVPIARTGYQEYLGRELPPGAQEEYDLDPDKIYKVYRSHGEVFSPATIASFEGKPFTDDHPTEEVTPQNISMYGKGHIQNVHRGTGKYENMLLADIWCTDENVANLILDKKNPKREVSCGYMHKVVKGAKGLEQKEIRGNHVALVENGRAGEKAAIQDSNPDAIKNKEKGEKKMAKSLFGKMFSAWAKDAEPGEIEEALKEMGKDETPEAKNDPKQGGEIEELKKDVSELKLAMSEVTNTLKQLVESDRKVHEEVSDEDKLEELEKGCNSKDSLENPKSEEAEEKENSEQLIESDENSEENEEEKPTTTDSAVLQQFIKAMKLKLLAIEDKEARSQAVDAFVAAVKDAQIKKPKSKNNYSALTKAINSNRQALDKKPAVRTFDEKLTDQVNAINKFNPHAKKEGK